jgi:TnpA family transposase
LTRGTLGRSCSYDADPTRRAIFAYNGLVRSIYTLRYLRYLRDPKLRRHDHRSKNRLEPCHQLRSAIAQVGRKK